MNATERRLSALSDIPVYPARLAHIKALNGDYWIECNPDENVDNLAQQISDYFKQVAENFPE